MDFQVLYAHTCALSACEWVPTKKAGAACMDCSKCFHRCEPNPFQIEYYCDTMFDGLSDLNPLRSSDGKWFSLFRLRWIERHTVHDDVRRAWRGCCPPHPHIQLVQHRMDSQQQYNHCSNDQANGKSGLICPITALYNPHIGVGIFLVIEYDNCDESTPNAFQSVWLDSHWIGFMTNLSWKWQGG